jgi:hypothetical protein
MRLFKRFPWLFIALGLVLIANNVFKFAPAQVLQPPLSFIIPILFIAIGAGFYAIRFTQKGK